MFISQTKSVYKIIAVHTEDLYPKGFQEFLAKYKKVNDGFLFVQFTNHADNTMDKKAFNDPDHKDPVGIYGYPLDYVLKHPGDIWYGRNASYLRVLKDTAKNSLSIHGIDSVGKANNILRKMGFDDPVHLMELAWKHYKKRIGKVNTIAKQFLTVVQLDLEGPSEKDSYGRTKHRVRSGAEQTALFKKAGYDAVWENSKNNKQAIINSREPEQTIFLTRGAFKVVDVFSLKDPNKKGEGQPLTVINPADLGSTRKLAAMVAEALEDKIIATEHENPRHNRTFWTKKGRRIEISFEHDPSYYETRKMGEKKHKEAKQHDLNETKVLVFSERGTIKAHAGMKTKFSVIVKDIKEDFARRQEDPDWKPLTKKAHQDAEQSAKDEYYRKIIEDEKRQRKEAVPENNASMHTIAKLLHMPFSGTGDADTEYVFYQDLTAFSVKMWRHLGHDTVLPLSTDDFDKVWAEFQEARDKKNDIRGEIYDEKLMTEAHDIFKKIYTNKEYVVESTKRPYSHSYNKDVAMINLPGMAKDLEQELNPNEE